MTDAALSVTQHAVEQFTETYLNTLDCKVDKQGDRWKVTIPEDAETELAGCELNLVCSADSDTTGDGEPLHPESSFFHTLLEEASERSPSGQISITAADTEITLPPWLVQSEVAIESADFTPYYNRTALVALFQLGIETVSEYQTEFLRTVAVDTRSEEKLPGLANTFLSGMVSNQETIQCDTTQIDQTKAKRLVERVREDVVEDIRPKIDEIHEAASRSADAEIEEYRQLQQQQIEELAEKEASLSNRVDGLSASIEGSTSQDERAENLKKRKELRAELEEVQTELEGIRQRREKGFPEKQREIRNRHALEVVVEPITLTEVQYEQGEIEFVLTNQTTTKTITVGYGSGVGVTENVNCDRCGMILSEENPVRLARQGIRCENCESSESTV